MNLNRALIPRETPSGRKPGKAAATRLDIIVTLARMIEERKGISECNIREIGERVGIQPSSIYYHFKSKDELLDELLILSVNLITMSVMDAIAALGPDANVRDRLTAAIHAHVSMALGDNDDDAAAIMRIYAFLPPAMKDRSRQARVKYRSIWKGLLEEACRKGEIRSDLDLDILLSYLLAGMGTVGTWYRPDRMTIDGVCQVIIDLHTEGGLIPQPDPLPQETQET